MSVEKCKSAALRYVASQLRTEGQIEDYLRRKEFSQEEIEQAMGMLREYKYVDDSHYCVCYYKEACRKGRGRRRIEQELERKRVPRSVIRETLDQFLSEDNPEWEDIREELLTEKERAMAAAEKMLNNHLSEGREADRKFFAKVGRRLVSLGYGSEVVYGVIGAIMRDRPSHKEEWEE